MLFRSPANTFAEKNLVIQNLSQALTEDVNDNGLINKWTKQSYPLRAALVMQKLAQTRNKIIDLSAAQDALIEATGNNSPEIKTLAAQILTSLNTPLAQKTIALMALDQKADMGIRISAFESLALSAKINGNLLDEKIIDEIYLLVQSKDIEPQLRSAAAVVFGALDLPSQKVKNLVLDQAKT